MSFLKDNPNQKTIYWSIPTEEDDQFECCVCCLNQPLIVSYPDVCNGCWTCYRECEHCEGCKNYQRRVLNCGHCICLSCLYGWMATCAKKDRPITCPMDRSVIDFDLIHQYVPRSNDPNRWPQLTIPSYRMLGSYKLSRAIAETRRELNIKPQNVFAQHISIIYAQTGGPFKINIAIDCANSRIADLIHAISTLVGLSPSKLYLRANKQFLSVNENCVFLVNVKLIQLIISSKD